MASPSGLDSDDFSVLQNLFENGLPSIGALDSIMAHVDSQIQQNSRELDECLQAVLTFTNELPGTKCLSSPQDSLKYMISSHVLEKSSCYDLDMDDIIRILRHVQNSLEKHPGCEELILEDLMALSSSEGISLPLRSTISPHTTENSVASLNSVQDNHEVLIEQSWDQIALKFRRYFTDKLSKLPLRGFEQELNLQEQKRQEYLQSLVTLYQPDDIWFCYQMLRVQQLETYFNSLLPQSADEEKLDVVAITKNCRTLAALISGMIDEDFAILSTGMFKKVSGTFKAIHDLYLDKYADEMSALIEEIYDDLKDIMHRTSAQSSSEFLFDGNHKKPLLKGYASPGEQGLLNTGARRSSRKASIVISKHYLQSLQDILLSVFHIDEHINSLYKMACTGTTSSSCTSNGSSGSSSSGSGSSGKRRSSKGSLRGVLKSVSPDILRRKSSNSSESSTSECSSMVSQSSLLDCRPAPKVIEKSRVEEKPVWEWKLIFKLISPDLVQCVDQVVWTSASTALEKEQKDWEIARTLDVILLPHSLMGGRHDHYPRTISKCVYDVLEDLYMLLPFAKAGNGGILHPVKTAFVHSANQLFTNIHGHYLAISQDIPKKAAAKFILVVLSSAVYIRNHLQVFNDMLGEEEGKKCFHNRYQQFAELCDILTNRVIQVHTILLSNILYDAQSYHWAEEKEFYENERCSFPIQMWHQHLIGLRTELWLICPPNLAQTLFTRILQESLAMLTRRYTRIKPSFRRVIQFRMDIITILLCMFDQMMYICDSSVKLLEPGYHQQPYYSIHNLCSILLSTLAVITSPIELLYKACKKIHQLQQQNSFSRNVLLVDDNHSYNSHWMSWIQPKLLQQGQKNYGDLQTTTALYLHTKLLVSQPYPVWSLVVQALVMKNFTLSILFLTQSLSQADAGCVLKIEQRSSSAPTEKETAVKQLFKSICTLLLNMSLHFPDAMGRVMLPVIDRYDQWKILDQLGACKYTNPTIPVWLETIFLLLKPFILRVLKPVLKKLLNHPNSTREIESVMSVITDLPCGCVPQSIGAFRTKRQQGCARDQVSNSVLEVLKQVSEHIYTLPTSFCTMFKILQDAAKEKNIQFAHGCLGLQIIALCLKTQLWAGINVEKMSGTSFSPETKEILTLLAEGVYATLVYSDMDLSRIEVSNLLHSKHSEWTNRKINHIVTFLNSDSSCSTPRHMPENTVSDFAEEYYAAATYELFECPKGLECLTDTYWLIVHNVAWLETQLDIQTTLPRTNAKVPSSFTANFTPVPASNFNPLTSFDEIGNTKLDQDKINKFDCNWADLLFRDLGLSIYGLRTLLLNRHELQDGAYLEEHERKPVEGLRLLLDYDTSDHR